MCLSIFWHYFVHYYQYTYNNEMFQSYDKTKFGRQMLYNYTHQFIHLENKH